MSFFKKFIKYVNDNANSILILIILIIILGYLFIGLALKRFDNFKNFNVYLSILALLISYISIMFTLEDSKVTYYNIKPYLNVTSELNNENLLIFLENVGKGELYNLCLNNESQNMINEFGKLESENFIFSSTTMCVNKKYEYKIILKDDNSIPLNYRGDLVLFFDDTFDNHYKQVVSICYNETGFHFMPHKVESRKKEY